VSKILKTILGVGVLGVLATLSLQTGLARWTFFELFAYVKGVDIVAPTMVREPPTDSPYQHWLETARERIPEFDGLLIDDVKTIGLPPWAEKGAGEGAREKTA
jgi:hypothetical protein